MAISVVVMGYCAALTLVGVLGGALALWIDPHAGVGTLMASGLVLAPLVLRRSADQAAAAVFHLPPADPFITSVYQSTVRTGRKGRLTVRSCPGDRVVVLRQRRRTMVLAPVSVAPSRGARRAARDLDLGQGWILPWAMRLVRLPGMYLAGFGQLRRLSRRYVGSTPPDGDRSIALFLVSFLAVPAALVGWVAAQVAVLLVNPHILAAYVALTGTESRNGRLGLRQRLLLPFTWYWRSKQEHEPFRPTDAALTAVHTELAGSASGSTTDGAPLPSDPVCASPEPGDPRDRRVGEPATTAPETPASTAEPYLVLIASFFLVSAVHLTTSWFDDAVVWWDERPVTATVVEIDTSNPLKEERPRISVGWHLTQQLTVMLPDGDIEHVESAAKDFRIGDSIQLADNGEWLRAVPTESAYAHGVNVVYGFGWAALFSFVITYQGNREHRDEIWDGQPSTDSPHAVAPPT